jgi:ABC-type transport system involved in Fe-S cluster assembly fused permease/ATPase subunit
MKGQLTTGTNLVVTTNSVIPAATGVVQKDNAAGGHIAGGHVTEGDFIQIEGDVIVQAPAIRETALGRLYRKLRNEAEDDKVLLDYIEQLKIFTRLVEDENVVGLDGKFEASGRKDQIDMAKAMKEMIYRQLRQNMFSHTFQTIYATLMGKIYEEFQTWVRPAIESWCHPPRNRSISQRPCCKASCRRLGNVPRL